MLDAINVLAQFTSNAFSQKDTRCTITYFIVCRLTCMKYEIKRMMRYILCDKRTLYLIWIKLEFKLYLKIPECKSL